MDDRELLELAAKAAGWTFPPKPEKGAIAAAQWNPLVNNSDAFHLLVKIQLICGQNPYSGGTEMVFARKAGFLPHFELINDDPYAATRRAIVRAAAEIGRAM